MAFYLLKQKRNKQQQQKRKKPKPNQSKTKQENPPQNQKKTHSKKANPTSDCIFPLPPRLLTRPILRLSGRTDRLVTCKKFDEHDLPITTGFDDI